MNTNCLVSEIYNRCNQRRSSAGMLSSILVYNRVRNFRGGVSNFNQSEARKQCFLASDWLKCETPPNYAAKVTCQNKFATLPHDFPSL